jgi:hypothetical protein
VARLSLALAVAALTVALLGATPLGGGLKPYDRTLVLPTQNLPAGAFVTQIFNTSTRNRILFRICNASTKPIDPPLGAWAYVVWRAAT